jgi:sugar-specific transcriptional regulator TrmB
MIVQQDFLNKLRDFGLNSYESKLWAALLSRGISTAGELSDIANVPRSRTYDVLESLEKKGFIIMKLGKPIKYIAVPPSEVLERVKKKVEEDAQTKADMLDNIKNDIMTTSPGLIKKADKLQSLLKSASDKGVKIRIISPTKKTDPILKSFADSAEVKTTEDVTGRIFLVDKKHVTFMLLNNEEIHDSYDTAIWVNTEFFSTTMTSLFEKTWKSAK